MKPSPKPPLAKSRLLGRLRADHGTSPISVIALLITTLMFAELIVMGGRLASTHADVSNTVRQAARTASVAAGPDSARDLADAATITNLGGGKRACEKPEVEVDTSSFSSGGSVSATVTCTVALGDLGFLRLPWPSVTLKAEATEIIETYRVTS